VTAGNSSQMSDGAAAVLLMSETALKRYGVTPIARFRSFAVAGVPPEVMGIGPVEAIPRALARPAWRRTTSAGSSSTKPSPRRRWR
jgi:acetyl-CoA acyltransferase